MYKDEKIKDAILEAIYITRWNKDGKTQYALLTNKELTSTIHDIISELDKAGFKIVTKQAKPKKNESKKTKRSSGRNRPVKELV